MGEIIKPIYKNRKIIIKDKSYIIKEIAFNDSLSGIGKFFAETKKEKAMFFEDSDNNYEGVYIYQDKDNPNIGYRIYQEFANPGFNGYEDDKLVAKLQERQSIITKSKFPTGIITLNGKIVGQQIPLFLNHSEIHEYCKTNTDKLPTASYKQVLDILKELYDNGIFYLDGHSKNFVVDRNSGHVEIIDFEFDKIEFDTVISTSNWKIFSNLNGLINRCNENSRVSDILKQCKVKSFDEAYEYVEEAEHNLIKSGRYCK